MKIRILVLCFLLFFACQKEEDYIQNVMVDYNLNLSLPEWADLQTVGNYIFIEDEGVKGIIVYRQDFNTYKTYDRNCSFEPSLSCARIDSVNSSIAICKCCNSKFLLSDGTPFDGPALLPLKQYQNNLSADFLYIYN